MRGGACAGFGAGEVLLFLVHLGFHSLRRATRARRNWFPSNDDQAGTVAVSKNKACAIAAFTVERWKGLVIRKVGSGRSPVSRRSGKAVMKITGTRNSPRMSLTASMPELS